MRHISQNIKDFTHFGSKMPYTRKILYIEYSITCYND